MPRSLSGLLLCGSAASDGLTCPCSRTTQKWKPGFKIARWVCGLLRVELHRQRAGDAARRSEPVACAPNCCAVEPRCSPAARWPRPPWLGPRSRTSTRSGARHGTCVDEALDAAVLHGPSRLDQDVANAMCLHPGHEHPAAELRAVVCSHCLALPADTRRSAQRKAVGDDELGRH
jgi:hypothetical protein